MPVGDRRVGSRRPSGSRRRGRPREAVGAARVHASPRRRRCRRGLARAGRRAACGRAATRRRERFDSLHFEGPGTDLTVGLLPTSHFAGDEPGSTTVDGVVFNPNLPTEEVFTTPDPERTEGVVTATKPLDIEGTLVQGLRVRFEGGRVVEIDADEGADALRARVAKDDGASRLGEVALVDREGRIGKTGTVFFNTLLDENAASHVALGNAYAIAGRRRGSRPDQPERDPHRLHDRQRRRQRHRPLPRRRRGASPARRHLADLARPRSAWPRSATSGVRHGCGSATPSWRKSHKPSTGAILRRRGLARAASRPDTSGVRHGCGSATPSSRKMQRAVHRGRYSGAAAIRSARGGRAPRRISCGSPRSANGTSITSKSRGTTVAANTSCASFASSPPK